MTVIKIIEKDNYKDVSNLATIIWNNLYTPILGYDQANYMSASFQSVEAIEKQITNGVKYYGIFLSEKMIGYLSYKKNDDSLFFDKIYLLDTVRAQSIGSQCMEFIEAKTIEMNCTSIVLKVEQSNSKSISIFEKWGFKVTESISRDIGEGFVLNGLLMTKKM